jgi:hypothetical protein
MMHPVDDNPHGTAVVMLTDAGYGLMKIRIDQTGHRQQKMSFQTSGIIFYHVFLHLPDNLAKPNAVAQT